MAPWAKNEMSSLTGPRRPLQGSVAKGKNMYKDLQQYMPYTQEINGKNTIKDNVLLVEKEK